MNQTIQNRLGEQLDYSFHAGSADLRNEKWIVILGHGLTGNKDRPVITDTAKALNAIGFDTLAFSFAGNGQSQGNFREATISKEVGDLSSVIDAVAYSYPKIAYIGHSMGAAVGVIQATHDGRLKALVSLAGMIDTKTFATTEFSEETPDQGLMWGETDCPLSSSFMQDLCQTIGTVAPLADCVSTQWLLIHGTDDDVVRPQDSECVKDLQGDAVDLVYIEGADHSFSEPPHKEAMLKAVTGWFQTIL